MAGIPFIVLGYFFAAVEFAWTYAWLVVPVMIAAWLLLFVPSETWAGIRSAITAPLRSSATTQPTPALAHSH
jgi:hypothetical protein